MNVTKGTKGTFASQTLTNVPRLRVVMGRATRVEQIAVSHWATTHAPVQTNLSKLPRVL